MILYVDSEWRLHVTNSENTLKEVVLSERAEKFLSDKCQIFVEGYIYKPAGEAWTDPAGNVIRGEIMTPWKPYSELAAAQAQYERDRAELQAAYLEGVNSV